MPTLIRDYETRGLLKLQDTGSWRYARDSRTEILCCAYCVDDGPVKLWTPPDPPPTEFFEAAAPQNTDWTVGAFNAAFEIPLEYYILVPKYGFPKFPLSRQRCIQAKALVCSLPPRLEFVAQALELLNEKDKAGHRLMLMMSKPRRPRKDEDPELLAWFDDPDRMARLYEYARQDVEVERELDQALQPLSDDELKIWQFDLRVNARGFYFDRKLAEAARAVAEAATPELDAECATSPVAPSPVSTRSRSSRRGWRSRAVSSIAWIRMRSPSCC